jgi:hypothetical protein
VTQQLRDQLAGLRSGAQEREKESRLQQRGWLYAGLTVALKMLIDPSLDATHT